MCIVLKQRLRLEIETVRPRVNLPPSPPYSPPSQSPRFDARRISSRADPGQRLQAVGVIDQQAHIILSRRQFRGQCQVVNVERPVVWQPLIGRTVAVVEQPLVGLGQAIARCVVERDAP